MSRGAPAEVSRDEVFGGAAVVVQGRSGYRYTADALWLIAASRHLAQGRVLDLGAGCGVVGLCLAAVPEVAAVTLVERQPSLAACARESVALTQPRCPVAVLEADLRQLEVKSAGGPFDLVVANPPFFAADRARPALHPERDSGRRALHGDLGDFARAASRVLPKRGRLAVVYPARQLTALVAMLRRAELGLRTLRFIRAQPGLPARLVVAVAQRGAAADVEVLPAWSERFADSSETAEARALRDPAFLSG